MRSISQIVFRFSSFMNIKLGKFTSRFLIFFIHEAPSLIVLVHGTLGQKFANRIFVKNTKDFNFARTKNKVV